MTETELSWIQRAANAAIEHAHRSGVKQIVCASGVSPSGPIHLGNLREVMSAHFVTEEIKSRGHDAVHLHSWDDYDRFRKVPAGLDEGLVEYVGRSVAAVPDPYGNRDSYAAHFIAEFTDALATMGVRMREVRQSEQYPRGTYNAAIRQAMDRRDEVFHILAGFQTEGLQDKPLDERRPPEDRTTIRTEFNSQAWLELDDQTQKGVRILDERLEDAWTLSGLTRLVYAIPKLLQGLPEDAPPSADLKKAQRSFFSALYRLLCSSDTGPRLPTLLLSIGQERIHFLLSGHTAT